MDSEHTNVFYAHIARFTVKNALDVCAARRVSRLRLYIVYSSLDAPHYRLNTMTVSYYD